MIFLLTDAEPQDDPGDDVIRRLSIVCRRANIQVNVVHFCSRSRTYCTLRQLARATRGRHKFVTLHELAVAKLKASRSSGKRASREEMIPLGRIDAGFPFARH